MELEPSQISEIVYQAGDLPNTSLKELLTSAQLISYFDRMDVYEEEGPSDYEFDVHLLRQVLEWAHKSHEVQDPSLMQHDQTVWLRAKTEESPRKVQEGFCNTAGCLAGNIALLRGTPEWYQSNRSSYWTADYMTDGETIEGFAREELGLTASEADVLFAGAHSVDDLEFIAQAICERRGLVF